uniref:Uncharacterized protein n=1 Tax=Dunaliella tertiolecta TaxID=3047 RepID=A0A7S3R5Q7_DUNTE
MSRPAGMVIHTRRMRASLAAGAVVPYLPDPAMQAHLEAQSSPERRAAATAASGQEQPLPYDQGGRPAGVSAQATIRRRAPAGFGGVVTQRSHANLAYANARAGSTAAGFGSSSRRT